MKSKFLLSLALVLGGHCFAAIIYPKAPEGGREIVSGHLDPKFLGVSRIEDLSIANPHRWYGVGLTNLASGRLLSTAESGSWRYILIHGTTAVGVATVFDADTKTGKTLRFGSLFETCFSKETLAALRIAEALPQVQAQDYELRFLDIPAISFVAVWLHGKSDDIIIPLPPTYNRFNAYQPYSESQVIKILEPEAKRAKIMWAKLDKQRQKENNIYVAAMMDYEKAHGGKCGDITLYGNGPRVEPVQTVNDQPVWVEILKGNSSQCGILTYKARVTYKDERYEVKRVEILEKLPETNNVSKP